MFQPKTRASINHLIHSILSSCVKAQHNNFVLVERIINVDFPRSFRRANISLFVYRIKTCVRAQTFRYKTVKRKDWRSHLHFVKYRNVLFLFCVSRLIFDLNRRRIVEKWCTPCHFDEMNWLCILPTNPLMNKLVNVESLWNSTEIFNQFYISEIKMFGVIEIYVYQNFTIYK